MNVTDKKQRVVLRLSSKALIEHALRVYAFFSLALVGGFFLFAHCVSIMPAASLRTADGIVALTGDEDRISEAVRLLAQGKAKRLLISGVNKSTGIPELITLNTAGWRQAFLFGCCVDLDKRALNTEDNAFETTMWVRRRGFHSLIVVTSTYHMPRTLIELRQSMREVELVPYPVKAPRLEQEWWTDPRTTWVLAKEYMKFLTAAARYAANALQNDNGTGDTHTRMVNARLG